MAAQGDQAHYLLAAEALRRGTVDVAGAYADPALYERLAQQSLSDADRDAHVIASPNGSRLIQGYGLPLALLPGWTADGLAGALGTMALIAAFASAQTQRLARHIAGDTTATRAAWALFAFTVPFLSFATEIYPNALGAALLVSVALWGIAPGLAPARAGVAAGVALFLTPRDGMTAALLVVAAFALGRRRVPLAVASLAMLAVACTAALLIYGMPLPYAGYFLGAAQVDRISDLKLVGLRPDIALPGMLFDRAFGLAGSAPWVFIGALGIVPLVRRATSVAAALLVAVFATLLLLALYGPWQGGWSPPNRYTTELLPLWTPFVAAALMTAALLWQRAVIALLVAPSLVASVWLAAVPRLAYTGNESQLARYLGKFGGDVTLLLPSFALDTFPIAQLKSVALAVALVALVAVARRRITT
jgi:hypothetical protein